MWSDLGQVHFSKEIVSLSFHKSPVAKLLVLVISYSKGISCAVVQAQLPHAWAHSSSGHGHWARWRPHTRSSAMHQAKLLHSFSLVSSGPVDPKIMPISFAICRTSFLAESGHEKRLLPLRGWSFCLKGGKPHCLWTCWSDAMSMKYL